MFLSKNNMTLKDSHFFAFQKIDFYNLLAKRGFVLYRKDSEGLWYSHPKTGFVVYLSKK